MNQEIISVEQKPEADFKLLTLVSVFIGMLVGMNLLGGKIITIFGVVGSVAVFMVPLTFAITDISTELYGKKFTRQLTLAGMITLVLLMIYSAIFVTLAPNVRFAADDAYRTIFGSSLRIIIASIVAFGLAQLQDVLIFDRVRKMTQGKYLWIRTNVSTFASELVDTTVFMFIAFYMMTPKFDALFVIKMIIPYFLLKIAFAILITPAVYAGVRMLRESRALLR
ncbi:MAG: VUT family protein [Candidatus Taylorbacteria bacterium]|nr:VUT family protein [Candidatus Taylorbacteria bacterium]